MFEFHGWAVLRSTCGQSVWGPKGFFHPDEDALLESITDRLRTMTDFAKEHIRLLQTVNGFASILVSGLLNHRDKRVYQLFEWLAEHGARSYGVLMTRDDEDSDRQYDPLSEFRMYRLALGAFTELDKTYEMPQNPPLPEPIWKDS
jgi:hypothetical protein